MVVPVTTMITSLLTRAEAATGKTMIMMKIMMILMATTGEKYADEDDNGYYGFNNDDKDKNDEADVEDNFYNIGNKNDDFNNSAVDASRQFIYLTGYLWCQHGTAARYASIVGTDSEPSLRTLKVMRCNFPSTYRGRSGAERCLSN